MEFSLAWAFCVDRKTCMKVSYFSPPAASAPPSISHVFQTQKVCGKYVELCRSLSLPGLTCYASQREKQWECTVEQKSREQWLRKHEIQGREEVLSSSLEIVSQIGPTRCFPFPLLGADACLDLDGLHVRSSSILTSGHDGIL